MRLRCQSDSAHQSEARIYPGDPEPSTLHALPRGSYRTRIERSSRLSQVIELIGLVTSRFREWKRTRVMLSINNLLQFIPAFVSFFSYAMCCAKVKGVIYAKIMTENFGSPWKWCLCADLLFYLKMRLYDTLDSVIFVFAPFIRISLFAMQRGINAFESPSYN